MPLDSKGVISAFISQNKENVVITFCHSVDMGTRLDILHAGNRFFPIAFGVWCWRNVGASSFILWGYIKLIKSCGNYKQRQTTEDSMPLQIEWERHFQLLCTFNKILWAEETKGYGIVKYPGFYCVRKHTSLHIFI